jgi:excisionase family DNA binding protein
MSAFKKGWVEQFRSDQSKEEALVRKAYLTQPHGTNHRRIKKPTSVASTPAIAIENFGDLPKILTVKEIADLLRFKDTESVTALIRGGELFAKKVGRMWRIPLWSFTRYMSEMDSSHVG